MSRARSVADLGNQTVLDVNAGDGTLKVGAGVTLENTGEAQFSGIVTASSIDTRNLIGNVSIGGTLTYEDVTNVDSVGIITAGNGLRVTDGGLVVSSGISTFAGITTVTGETLFTKQLNVSGISTLGSNVVVGGATTELVVTGDARVTGNIAGASLYDTQVSAISKEITDSAVDVFVYDTSKDSDGGAWRKKTKHTSWYNEAASLTRGSRKEFPAVAVIVAEATKITIYDGDDPDLSTWMVFNVSNNTWLKLYSSAAQCSCITALNGILCAGGNGTGIRLAVVDFIKDNQYLTEAGYTYYNNGIETRNDTTTFSDDGGSKSIVNNVINDVAMTVLPNAPIDDATGLPIPTIAVATDGGISVIRDDGIVVNKTRGVNETHSLAFDADNSLIFSWGTSDDFPRHISRFVIADWHLTSNISFTDNYFSSYNEGAGSSAASVGSAAAGVVTVANSGRHFGIEYGTGGNPDDRLVIFHPRNLTNNANQNLSAFVTSSYNTGYMHGDIKGAFLSDTDIEDGVELISNGTFNTDTTGWTVVGGGSATVSSGQAQLTNNGTTNGSLDQTITTVVGKTYEITANITPQGGGPLPRLYVGNRWVQVGSNSNSSQTVTLIFQAYSTSTIVSINANTNVNNAVTLVDNVSMKLTNDVPGGNLLVDGSANDAGDFNAQSDVDSWTAQGSTLSLSSGKMRITTGSGQTGYAYKSFKTAAGKQYVFSVNLTHNSGTRNARLSGVSPTGTDIVDLGWGSSTADFYHVFTATSATTYVAFGTNGGYSEVDNVVVTISEADRSVNNKGLQVFGTVPKSAVATGADLVSYGPFTSSSPYKSLQQPHNSDFLFGTSDWCISGWVKNNSNNNNVYEDIITFGNIGQVGYNNMEPGTWFVQMNKDLGFNLYYKTSSGAEDSGWTNHASGFNKYSLNGLDIWYKITITKSGDRIYTWANDDFIGSKAVAGSFTTSSNLDDMTLTIGYEGGTAYGPYIAQHTKMALWKISRSSPSPEQIKKMYEDEKVLFQPNAKATLYGSSDAVTGLAFDDTTNLLHVGTSAGRSEFQGLRRINNTTEAVTTAISVSNGLVAEQ